jgi:regulator of protease activity HflC (stomatin/prohibitin superfamily)
VNNTQTYRTDVLSVSPQKGVNTYTIDNQEVDIVFNLFYRVPVDQIAYVHTNVQDFRQRLFTMTIDRLKVEVGKVNVTSLAQKRGQLRDAVKNAIAQDAKNLGIEVTDFQITELTYDEQFRKAVQQAAVQKAQIETREYERQQAEKTAERAAIEAEGRANALREEAKGQADANLLIAQASAKAIQLRGEAEAAAIRAQADALRQNQQLVELRKAEKWNGELPKSMLSNVMPFMNVDQGLK